jgi:hypothetical protein
MNADLFWWLKEYGIKKTIKQKIWSETYFWHDSFGQRLWIIPCKLFGHKYVQQIESYTAGENEYYHCFHCESDFKSLTKRDKIVNVRIKRARFITKIICKIRGVLNAKT